MEVVIYRLKNGKTKGDWQLPLTDILVPRIKEGENIGLRKLKFVPGVNSYWAEDLAGDLTPKQIWFTDGRLYVPKEDTLLNGLLQTHTFFNKYYEIFDKNAEAVRELNALRAKDKVIELISGADVDKIVSTSMAIFGIQASTWDDATAELQLRKFAESNPQKLMDELNSKTYESKYLSAMAFKKQVVKYNLGKTAVIWNDETEGEILRLARGESGILKLGELLSKRNDETELLLHAIAEKIEKMTINIPKKDDFDKDAEIARLRAELAKKESDLDLDLLRDQYSEKFAKEAPIRFKNDAEWLKSKLSE